MDKTRPRSCIPQDIEDRLPLSSIDRVTFFKRDELTSDLLCCEVEAEGEVWFFHEEADGWERLISHLEKLPGLRTDWRGVVVVTPFAPNRTVAYVRPA